MSISTNKRTRRGLRGFTLIEMMVSVTLFSVVMLVSVGSLLSLTNANRKAQALQSVMDNLNVALDGMVRSIRMGSNYHGAVPVGAGDCASAADYYDTRHDCLGGGTLLAFEAFGGDPADRDDQWIYLLKADHRIYKSTLGNPALAYPLTSPDVEIDDLRFYVVGTTLALETDPQNTIQPKVVIIVQGKAGHATSEISSFHIQATAVQRQLDVGEGKGSPEL